MSNRESGAAPETERAREALEQAWEVEFIVASFLRNQADQPTIGIGRASLQRAYDTIVALRAALSATAAQIRLETECPACSAELIVHVHSDGSAMVMTSVPVAPSEEEK